MLTGVYETLRSAGRDLTLELGEQAGVPERLAELHAAAQVLAADPDATEKQLASANAALALGSEPRAAARPRASRRKRRPRGRVPRRTRPRCEQAAFDELAARDSELLQELLDLFAAEYAAAKQRESALDFEDLQLLRARPPARRRRACARRSSCASARSWSTSSRTRTACSATSSTCCATGRTRPTCSSSATSSSRSTASATLTSPSSASAASARRSGCRSRATTARGRRCSRPSTICSARSSATATSRWPPRASSPIRCSAIPSSCSSATSGATARRARAGARARRRRSRAASRELVDDRRRGARRDRAALRRRHRRRALRVGAARARTCRPIARPGRGYFGQQQVVDLLAYLRLLHNRYDDEALVTVLASPFVGVSNDALVHIRRHAGRRPALHGHRTLAARAALRRRRAARARVQAALRAAGGRVGAARRSSGSARRSSRRTTTTSPCSRSWDGKRRYANLRKLMRLARSYEDAARRRHRGLRPVHPRPAGGRRVAARGGLGGGGRRRRAPAHDPRREGARVQGRDRRRRRPRHRRRAVDRRDPRAARRHASASACSTRSRARSDGVFELRGRCARPRSARTTAERLRLYYVAMTRAIDRLIVSGAIDPDRHAGPRDADRLGARAARHAEAEVERAPPSRSSSSAATRASCSPSTTGRRARPTPSPSRWRSTTRASSRSSRSCRRTRRPRGYRLPELRAAAGAAAAQGAPSLVLGARALRALLVPLLRRARRGLREERGTMPGSALA